MGDKPEKSKTVQEGVRSDATNAAIVGFYNTALKEAKRGRLDIAELGEAYEGMGSDLPIVGQYVEARRWLFDQADKIGIGRAVRVLYHSTETGARVSAALSAEAAVLAASNYGAASSTTLAAAAAMGAAAGPIGVGVAVVTGVLSALFGADDPKEQAERAKALVLARTTAKAALAGLDKWPPAARDMFLQTAAGKTLVTMASYVNDPLSFLAVPTIREQLRAAIYSETGVIVDDASLVAETKKRLDARNHLRIAIRQGHDDMKKIVIWTGPVGAKDVYGATVSGAEQTFIPCLGDRTPKCADLAESWTDASGRKLPGMLRAAKVSDAAGDAEIYLGAFSAGGHVVKRVLLNDADRAQVHAVLLADATYVAEWKDKASRIAAPIEGFVKFGLDAARDGRVFIATASSAPNKTWPTGAESLHAIRRAMEEARAGEGAMFDDVTAQADVYFPGLRPPVSILRCNNVLFADFGGAYKHPEHATVIAPVVWTAALPHLLGGASASPPSPAPPASPERPAEELAPSSGGWLSRATSFFKRLPTPIKLIGAGVAVATVVAAGSSSTPKKQE
jgi:hypothetical protein